MSNYKNVVEPLRNLEQWVLLDKFGEVINVPKLNERQQTKYLMMPLKEALILLNERKEAHSLGFVLTETDDFCFLTINSAIIETKGTKEAIKAAKMLKDAVYAEIDSHGKLNMLLKSNSPELRNYNYKNIKASFAVRDQVVPITGNPRTLPRLPWSDATEIHELLEYLNKQNSRINDKWVELPEWYELNQYNKPKLVHNVLATHLLERSGSEYRVVGHRFFVRKYGNGIYEPMSENEVKKEISEYISERYLSDNDINKVYNLMFIRTERDDELLHPKRMQGRINFKNGVFDVETGEFMNYLEDYHAAIQLNANFDIDSGCQQFIQFLNSVLPDEDDRLTVQEIMGYLLTTEIRAEKAFIFYGPGKTGKSTLISVIEEIIGKKHVSNIPFQELGDKFKKSSLFGKLLNTFSDLPQKKISDTGYFKALISGDPIIAENKGENPFMFSNSARMLFSTNSLPINTIDSSTGFYRRLLILHFNQTIPEKKTNRHLKEQLLAEKDGIVQWALLGLTRLIQNNYSFTVSENTERLMRHYQHTNNSVVWFLDKVCVISDTGSIGGKELYEEYQKICREMGLSYVTLNRFYQQIEENLSSKGVFRKQDSVKRAVAFQGLQLKQINQWSSNMDSQENLHPA